MGKSTEPKDAESTRDFGKQAEDEAVRLLRKAGYKILERNFTCKLGEIDIVASESGTLVFVEVRARSQTEFGLPQETVDDRKQRRLVRLAEFYLVHKKLGNVCCRFDVAALTLSSDGWHLELIRNAFP